MDGVLIDCRDAVYAAYKKGFEAVGLYLDRSAFEGIMNGLPWPESAMAVFPGISGKDLARVRAVKKSCFEDEMRRQPVKVDKVACSLAREFSRIGCEVWLVTAGSEKATALKLEMLPVDLRSAFSVIETGIDKTGDSFYARLRKYSVAQHGIILVDDDERVWRAARTKMDGIAVVEWGR